MKAPWRQGRHRQDASRQVPDAKATAPRVRRLTPPAGQFPRFNGLVARAEHVVKKPVWGCQMCGQCVLHSTGLTCPMTCPKTLRNGPCGGVRADGTCEVKPEMRCVWLKAYERSERLPLWRGHLDDVRPPVDNTLQGTSSWLNLLSGRDRQVPAGWARMRQSHESGADVEP